MKVKLDHINLQIIRHLLDGRKSYNAIAEELEITENTVRSRVNRLLEEGIVEISGLIDPEKTGNQIIIVGVKMNNMNLLKKGAEFSQLRGVLHVAVVTGRYDFILQVLLDEEYGILEFYDQQVSKISGVQSVETFIVYKAYNLMVPYVLNPGEDYYGA